MLKRLMTVCAVLSVLFFAFNVSAGEFQVPDLDNLPSLSLPDVSANPAAKNEASSVTFFGTKDAMQVSADRPSWYGPYTVAALYWADSNVYILFNEEDAAIGTYDGSPVWDTFHACGQIYSSVIYFTENQILCQVPPGWY
jgi:hypothetical protein